MNLYELIETANQRITERKSEKPFEVKQLYADIWNDLSKGDKIRMGQLFAGEVANGSISGVHRVEDGKNSRHNRYVKNL